MSAQIEALRVKLAGMNCLTCGGTGSQREYAAITDLVADLKSVVNTRGVLLPCSTCHGTGYLLDKSVRVPCVSASDSQIYWGFGMPKHRESCACAGRGWTPSHDREMWAKALAIKGFQIGLFFSETPVDGVLVTRPDHKWTAELRQYAADAEAVLTALARKGQPCLT